MMCVRGHACVLSAFGLMLPSRRLGHYSLEVHGDELRPSNIEACQMWARAKTQCGQSHLPQLHLHDRTSTVTCTLARKPGCVIEVQHCVIGVPFMPSGFGYSAMSLRRVSACFLLTKLLHQCTTAVEGNETSTVWHYETMDIMIIWACFMPCLS